MDLSETITLYSSSASELAEVVDTLANIAKQSPSIFAFYGSLGAGKTTLIKELISTITAVKKTDVTSPTFTYVQTYGNEPSVHHFDLYRINTLSQFEAMGFGEYLEEMCFIEWPEVIEEILPLKTVRIRIGYEGEGRSYEIIKSKRVRG